MSRFRGIAPFILLLFATMMLNAVSNRMSPEQIAVIVEFSRLPLSADGQVTDVVTASEEMVSVLFGENRDALGKQGFLSHSHFFLELAVQPERVDQLPFFPISKKLARCINLPIIAAKYSYSTLAETREMIKILAEDDTDSGLHLLPVEYTEVKHLEIQLQQYEAVRNIFRLGWSKSSFSQFLTEMITFLPDGLENYQNRLEGLPCDVNKVEDYLSMREILKGDGANYGIVLRSKDPFPEFVSIETTVTDSLNRGLFDPVSMWFAEFYDAYLDGNFYTTNRALKSILDVTPTDLLQDPYAPSFDIRGILSIVCKVVSIVGALAGILFALIALYTGKKAGLLAIILSVTAWVYYMGWLILGRRTGTEIAFFQLPVLFSVFGLLPLIGIRYYRAASICGATILSGAVILLQFQVPLLPGGANAYEFFSPWFLALTLIWQLAGVFAIGAIWQMIFSSVVIFWTSRIFDDKRLRLRQLVDVSLPLLRLAMISLLFSVVLALILFLFTQGRFGMLNAVVAASLAMIFQCGLFLQLRWINRLDIAGLFRNHFTLLILSLFLLMSYSGSTDRYFPNSFVTNFSPLLKTVVFIGGGSGIVLFNILPLLPRIRQWIRHYRKPKKPAQR